MGILRAGVWDLAFPPGPPERMAEMFSAAVVADAVRRHDADLAQSVETMRDWRHGYHPVFRALTALAVSAPGAAHGVARDGLHSMRTMLRFASGATVTSLDAADVDAAATGAELGVASVEGAAEPVRRLEIPWQGRVLADEELLRQLTDWQDRGIVEPGFAAAVRVVAEHPEWLSLPGFRMTLTGAAAVLSPLRPLLSWGAQVLAVELPGRGRWDRLRARARAGAGVMRYPVTDRGPGVDIGSGFPALARWISAQSDARPVLGSYASRAGAAGLRIAAASDVLAETVLRRHPDAVLALHGSSADCYAVPESVVLGAREHLADRGIRGSAQDLLHRLAPRSLYHLNYTRPTFDADGAPWGLFDNLPYLAGPDYALAQRLPRWRATLARESGHGVSYTVTPPTWTATAHEPPWRSAAHRAAGHFGIEIFDPATARVLLAAKLVADLFAPEPAGSNPESLFTIGALHGGLWRQPFTPRSLVAPAALTGSIQTLRDRIRPV
ncbi:hypothetical protein ABZ319_30775 [Nocardia sp. NPDC005978]|uniref:hypothetical protein n=1 Tax=Nocardia sp. NPDC005978 TaxID=3156725 RepID=UPI0033B97985